MKVTELKKQWWLIAHGHRKVLKYLVFMTNKFYNVFPSLPQIAKAIGMSARTVHKAISFWKKFGILNWKKRGYDSNLYFVDEEICALNFNDEAATFPYEKPFVSKEFMCEGKAECRPECNVFSKLYIFKEEYKHNDAQAQEIEKSTPDNTCYVNKNVYVAAHAEKQKQQSDKPLSIFPFWLPPVLKRNFMKLFNFASYGNFLKRCSEHIINKALNSLLRYGQEFNEQQSVRYFVKMLKVYYHEANVEHASC